MAPVRSATRESVRPSSSAPVFPAWLRTAPAARECRRKATRSSPSTPTPPARRAARTRVCSSFEPRRLLELVAIESDVSIKANMDPYASISELSAQIRERTISPVLVVDACLDRIEALNPHLNAFITVSGDAARAAATAAESELTAGHWRGPLHGVPVAVKDFYDTAGIKTTAGFEHFANRTPPNDADVVTRLKAAGAIVIGKTNMDMLGMATTGLTSFYGPVRNPWNADSIPGGSSCGSAAAVASGMCYATVDTDAIGSCRLPAACCGVVGFKGTYGLVSSEGI